MSLADALEYLRTLLAYLSNASVRVALNLFIQVEDAVKPNLRKE